MARKYGLVFLSEAFYCTIIPNKSLLKTLVMKHKIPLYGRNALTSQAIMQTFWNAADAIKAYIRGCVTCHGMEARTTQRMTGIF